MKYVYSILITGLFIINLNAQIPNNGFENWSGGEPGDWLTNNLPGAWITVSSNGTSHSGSLAAKLEVANFNGGPIYPALFTTFPINQNYGSVNGYYQFHPTISEMLLIGLVFTFKNGQLIGTGAFETETASSNYAQFSIEIFGNGQIPDSVMIQFQILSDSPTDPGMGTYALIDQLSFGQTTSVTENPNTPVDFILEQNFPNPFNPSTKISWQSPVSGHQTLKVYDIIGNEVATLVNEFKSAGSYEIEFNASKLASGVYIYKLHAGGLIETKKMIVMK